VLLFQDGPLADVLRQNAVATSICRLSDRGAAVRKASGPLQKAASLVDVYRLARQVSVLASNVDVIYANTAKALAVSVIAGRLARKPVIYHLHDILSADHFSWSNRRLLVFLANRVNHVIANSHATAQSLCDHGGRLGPSRVTVVYNGIAPEPFDRAIEHTESLRRSIRQSIGLIDEPVIGLFGRFASWKGQHLAIEAIARLPDVHLMLVGDALFREDEYVGRLKDLASQPSVKGRVHFMGFRDDVAALMRATDIVVHCSTAPEPFGRVIVEAMLAKRPIVASRAGGAREIVNDQVTGLLFEPDSVDQVVDKVSLILSGTIDVPSMVDTAALDARERFDLAARVDDINRVIDQVARR